MLTGLKVIDAASYVAGPAAATVMGDFGAEVIKVEPLKGDAYRGLASRYRTDYNWLLTSRNKRSLALDITSEIGREVLLHLLDEADVFIVNFNLKQLEKFQLHYATLKKRNPRLIFAQVTGYGSKGPEANRRAFDVAAWWARTGLMDLMKPVAGPPINGVGGVGDHASAMSLFGAIMMALYRRETTGQGSYVTTSLLANGVWSMGMHLQGAIAGYDLSKILEGKGYRSPFVNSYRTRDNRYIILVVVDPQREWPKLCAALGHKEWLKDLRFTNMDGIMQCRDEVRAMFSGVFATLNLKVACQALDAADVSYSVVEKLKDVINDAQLIENEVLIQTGSDDLDYQWTVNSPVEIEGVKKTPVTKAANIGEHSAAILRELGYNDAAVQQLVESATIRQGDSA